MRPQVPATLSEPEAGEPAPDTQLALIPVTATLGDEVAPANQRDYFHGGLMRCCTETLKKTTKLTSAGDRLDCAHCRNAMVVGQDGNWKWVGRWQSVR